MLNDQQLLNAMWDKKGMLQWEVFHHAYDRRPDFYRHMMAFRQSGQLPQEVRTFCQQRLATTLAA